MAANQSDSILQAALRLPTRERLKIARDLLDSVDDEAGRDQDWEASWTEELERRTQAMRDGTAELLDGEAVLAELDAALKGRRRPKAKTPPRKSPGRRRSK